MYNTQIARQMVQFNKNAFDNSFIAMNMVYEQNEKMIDSFVSQANWVPDEGKKAIKDWMSSYRNGCSEFKKQVDNNFAKVEDYFEKA